eukprot:m.36931 g.36931  ORF g.36931 m.36931 type:complete len:122 (-) comp9203_c1_seq1:1167-1532(-)
MRQQYSSISILFNLPAISNSLVVHDVAVELTSTGANVLGVPSTVLTNPSATTVDLQLGTLKTSSSATPALQDALEVTSSSFSDTLTVKEPVVILHETEPSTPQEAAAGDVMAYNVCIPSFS